MNLTDNCARFFVVVTFLTFGEACLKYLERQKSWESHDELKKKRAGSYSLRYSYSVREHLLDIDNGSMSLAMGHSIETHCCEYP